MAKNISENDETKTLEEIRQQIHQSLSYDPPFEYAPLTTMEVFTGKDLSNINQEYKQVMKPYGDYIYNIDSDRAKEYRDDIWSKYEFEVWPDYKWRNDIGTFIDKDKVIKSHKSLLNELSYDEDLESMEFDDGSNKEMSEQEHVLERLKHIPPDENHRMVKDTEHHVSGMMSNIYRRVHPLQYSPTIIASGGGGTWGYHYKISRGKLTNRERARIQTFPDDFMFHGKNAEVRKQIGNAVPPLGAKRVGECLLEVYNILEG